MAIVFPASPSVNDTFNEGSITYKWDGAKWIGLGITPADRLVEGSNSLEIDGNNNLIYSGGNFAVGTSTANNTLTLYGDSSSSLRISKSGVLAYDHTFDGSTYTIANNNGSSGIDIVFGTKTAGGEAFRITSDGQLQAIGASDVRLTLGSGGTAGTNNSIHIRADGNNLLFMNKSGGITKFESNGVETLNLAVSQSTLYGTSDGILNLDSTNVGGSFMRFKQSGTTKCWVGSAEQMGGGTGADQDDLGLRATGSIILRANGAERLRVHEDGYVTTPNQPSFQCVKNNNFNFTANTASILTPWTEKHDTGSDFNNTTGVFTAPVAGKYFFYVSAMAQRQDNGDYQVRIYKNGTQYVGSNDMEDPSTTTFTQTTINGIVDLAANDEVTFVVRNGSGTSTFIYQTPYTHCGGYLIG